MNTSIEYPEISTEEVQRCFASFVLALKECDLKSLREIYADDYTLVRPNGDLLGKKQILEDLEAHSMRFTSFEVIEPLIRTKGPVGILLAEVRNTWIRAGKEGMMHARQIGIFSKRSTKITISHFQSTNMG